MAAEDVVYRAALDNRGVKTGLSGLEGIFRSAGAGIGRALGTGGGGAGGGLLGLGSLFSGLTAGGVVGAATLALNEYAEKHEFAAAAIDRTKSAVGRLTEQVGRGLASAFVPGGALSSANDWIDGFTGAIRSAQDAVAEFFAQLAGKPPGEASQIEDLMRANEALDRQQKKILADRERIRAQEREVFALETARQSSRIGMLGQFGQSGPARLAQIDLELRQKLEEIDRSETLTRQQKDQQSEAERRLADLRREAAIGQNELDMMQRQPARVPTSLVNNMLIGRGDPRFAAAAEPAPDPEQEKQTRILQKQTEILQRILDKNGSLIS